MPGTEGIIRSVVLLCFFPVSLCRCVQVFQHAHTFNSSFHNDSAVSFSIVILNFFTIAICCCGVQSFQTAP